MKTLQEKTVELSHRAALVEAATAVLNEYTPFKSHHRVTFHTDDTQPTPWIIGQLERTDGTPIADSTDPLDRKLVHLKDASVRIRPFFLPMCATPWAETDANEFTDVNFDYAAILGYGIDQDGKPFLKAILLRPHRRPLGAPVSRRKRRLEAPPGDVLRSPAEPGAP